MSGFWWDQRPTLEPDYKLDEHGKWHFVLRHGAGGLGAVEAVSTVQGFASEAEAKMAVETLARGFHIA